MSKGPALIETWSTDVMLQMTGTVNIYGSLKFKEDTCACIETTKYVSKINHIATETSVVTTFSLPNNNLSFIKIGYFV